MTEIWSSLIDDSDIMVHEGMKDGRIGLLDEYEGQYVYLSLKEARAFMHHLDRFIRLGAEAA